MDTLVVLLFPLPYFLHATPSGGSGGLHSSLDGNTGGLQLVELLIHGHTSSAGASASGRLAGGRAGTVALVRGCNTALRSTKFLGSQPALQPQSGPFLLN